MIGDGLADALTFSDAISGDELPPPEPLPGESPETGSRTRRTGRKRTSRVRTAPPRPAARDAGGAAAVRAAKAELMAYVELTALIGSTRCVECATVVAEQAEPFADALARLCARNPAILRLLRSGTLMADAGRLLAPARRIYKQIHDHHFVPPADATDGAWANGAQNNGSGPGTRYAPYAGTGAVG